MLSSIAFVIGLGILCFGLFLAILFGLDRLLTKLNKPPFGG